MTDTMLSAATDGGHLVKMEVDYSATCDERLPRLKAEAAEGRLQEAINGLLALEKQTRTVRDGVRGGALGSGVVVVVGGTVGLERNCELCFVRRTKLLPIWRHVNTG